MEITIFTISFIISLGLSTFGVMISYRLKKLDEKRYASSLFYYIVFMVAFGFYSIWSHLIFSYLLDDVIVSENTLQNVLSIFPLLGIPLLIVGWYLFVQFSNDLIGNKLNSYVSFIYFPACILIFLLLGNYFKNQLISDTPINLFLIFEVLSVLNLAVVALGIALVLTSTKKLTVKLSKLVTTLLLFSPVLFSTIALFAVYSHWLLIILFVLFYFSELAIAPAYIYFKREEITPEQATGNFDMFCLKFEISNRESEIIREICRGKTNQEIADSLFITVQTVKDHAHRIYTKTGVKNRVQLINLVNKKQNQSL